MASSHVDLAKKDYERAIKFPIFVKKRPLDQGNKGKGDSNASPKQKCVLFANNSGTYRIPSINEAVESDRSAGEGVFNGASMGTFSIPPDHSSEGGVENNEYYQQKPVYYVDDRGTYHIPSNTKTVEREEPSGYGVVDGGSKEEFSNILDHSSKGGEENNASHKQKPVHFADDTGAYQTPSSIEAEESIETSEEEGEEGESKEEFSNLLDHSNTGGEENNTSHKEEKPVHFADDAEASQTPSNIEAEESKEASEEDGEEGESMEDFKNPWTKSFLEQITVYSDSDEEANANTKVWGAKAETLFTTFHVLNNDVKKGQRKKYIRFSCNVCEEEFKHRRTCIRHIRKHTGERPFKCLDCGQTYTQEDNLNRHLQSHAGVKDFECPICSKAFLRKGSLVEHMLLHNAPKDRPYPCGQCNKGFVKRSHLQRHLKRHMDEFEFVCTECGKGFHENRNLLDHFSRRHINPQKPGPKPGFKQDPTYKPSIKKPKEAKKDKDKTYKP